MTEEKCTKSHSKVWDLNRYANKIPICFSGEMKPRECECLELSGSQNRDGHREEEFTVLDGSIKCANDPM